jgi:hypothetical protein
MRIDRRIAAILFLAAGAAAPCQDGGSRYEAEVQDLADTTKVPYRCVESPSFVWATALPEAQTRPLVDVGERALKLFLEWSGAREWTELWRSERGPEKALMILSPSPLQHRKAVEWYAARYKPWPGFVDAATPQSYFPLAAPRVVALMHLKPITPTLMTYVVAHEVGHLAITRWSFNNQIMPPWLEEGFAALLEAKVLNKNNCYCFQGTYGDSASAREKMAELEWRKWKETVQGLARRRRDRAMKSIVPMTLTQLGPEEVGKAAAVIEWLLQTDRAKFFEFVTKLKRAWPQDYEAQYTEAKGEAQNRALKEVYGFGLDTIDEQWRASFK